MLVVWHIDGFNSLLEMLKYEERPIYMQVLFQFSIGDAKQIAESDAAVVLETHSVSILYWRCRVLWSFVYMGF